MSASRMLVVVSALRLSSNGGVPSAAGGQQSAVAHSEHLWPWVQVRNSALPFMWYNDDAPGSVCGILSLPRRPLQCGAFLPVRHPSSAG